MKEASSLARYVHALAISSGLEPRPSGTVARNAFSLSGVPKNAAVLDTIQRVLLVPTMDNSQAGTKPKNWTDTVEPDLVLGVLDRKSSSGVDDGSL